MQLRPYQQRAIQQCRDAMMRGRKNVLLVLPTGCHEAQQGILTFSGNILPASSIDVGDWLMGPDSLPREVLSLCRGRGDLYKIVPLKGSPWIVNGDHVLTLVRTNTNKTPKFKCENLGGHLIDVSVHDWLQWPKWRKHIHKLFRVSVNFPFRFSTPIDPYFLGVLLGDGTLHGCIGVTSADPEVIAQTVFNAEQRQLKLTKRPSKNKSNEYRMTNPGGINSLLNDLKSLDLNGLKSHNKYIPRQYKSATREIRLQVLAGLMDTDGSLSHNGFDFISKSYWLAKDVAFVARSCGLAAYEAKTTKTCQTGFNEEYYRVSISGDTSIIPCKIPRKQAAVRRQSKDVLRTGFHVEPIGSGEYFGWTLSGDGRYLLDDFTVTHNSGKTPTALEIMRCTVEKGRRTLFLADRIQLVIQAHERASEWGVPHGLLMSGHDMDLTRSVQIGSKDTIYSRCFKGNRFDLPRFDLIVLDEAHRGQNTSALATVNANPNAYLIGLTATPAGVSGKGLGDLYQDLIIGATYSELRDLGFLVPNVVFAPTLPDLSKVQKNADGDFVGVQAEKVMQDKKIIGDVWENWKRLASGRRTLVFGTGVPHSIELRDMFRSHGVTAEHIDGGTPDDERQEHFEAFKRGYLMVLCNYGVLDTGFDAPWCACVVIVRPTESRVLWMQMANRGGRPWDGLDENGNRIGEPKTDCVVIDHGGNVYRHGYPDEDIPWTLDTGKKIEQVVNEWRTGQGERQPIACPKCHRYRERGNVCPFCGHQSARQGRQVEFADGDLGLIDRSAVDQKQKAEELGKHWRKCLARMAYMGRSCASARALMYKESKVWVDERTAVSPRPKEHEWQMLVGDLYPGFVKKKKVSA